MTAFESRNQTNAMTRDPVTQERAALIAQGVPADVNLDIWLAPIIPRRDGSFDFAESDEPPFAIVLPIDPQNPSGEDAVAFYSSDPTRWWRSCAAPLLNPEAVERAAYFHTPLKIWTTPLSYLRAAGDGSVILDRRANLQFWFAGVASLEVENLEFAEAIDRRLRAPIKLPAIMVRSVDA